MNKKQARFSAFVLALLLFLTACVDNTQILPPSSVPADTFSALTDPVKNYTVAEYETISFDSVKPPYAELTACWDAMGIDTENNVIYAGFTMTRTDMNNIEDFAVFSYAPSSGEVKFIGTFINASKAANNYQNGEEIPKGHTRFWYIDGKMYMASQPFHDMTDDISELGSYCGAHLYAYDIAKGTLTDLSASLAGGVVVKNEGIIALTYMPERKLLVGLTHPLSNLVFYDINSGKVVCTVTGIPWADDNPLSREIVACNDRIYLCRGAENYWQNSARTKRSNVYYYDYAKARLVETEDLCFGGFWNGQVTTKDNKTTYISTCMGELFKLSHETGRVEHVANMTPPDTERTIDSLYSISLSPDESFLFYIPSFLKPAGIVAFDLRTETPAYMKRGIDGGAYTGSTVVDNNGYYYFARFGTTVPLSYEGGCQLIRFKVEAAY